ncbi:MAG: diguanylate cyclase [Gemmatimonadota bacterium]
MSIARAGSSSRAEAATVFVLCVGAALLVEAVLEPLVATLVPPALARILSVLGTFVPAAFLVRLLAGRFVLSAVTVSTKADSLPTAPVLAESTFRALADDSPIAIFRAAVPGGFTWTNPYFQKLTGQTREGSLESGWASSICDADRGSVLEAWDEATRVAAPFAREFRLRRPDGEVRWISARASALATDEGVAVQYGGTYEDITERKRTEERLHQLAAIVDCSDDAIIGVSLDGTVLSWNSGATRIYGFTAQEAVGADIKSMILPEDRPDESNHLIERAGRGERISHHETVRVRKDGSRIDISITVTPVQDDSGQIIGVSTSAHDVTERRAAGEELRRTNEQLLASVGELERRSRENGLLNEMGDLLQSCHEPDEALPLLGQFARQLFPAHAGMLGIVTASRLAIEPIACWGDSSNVSHPFPVDDCWAIRRRKPHTVDDADAGARCAHMRHLHSTGSICVPIIAQGDIVALLHLTLDRVGPCLATESRQRRARGYQRLAATFAEQAGLALSNLRLRDELRLESIRDPLTGLFNRRYLEESLAREVSRATRQRSPLGVIMIDIDHFKKYNDSFGHAAGDLLLREIGAVYQRQTRKEDIICRYGGEEFTLILPDASLDSTRQRAEDLRNVIRQTTLEHEGGSLGNVTVSLGVAAFPDHGLTPTAILKAADAALYRAKTEGRNRVVVSTQEIHRP